MEKQLFLDSDHYKLRKKNSLLNLWITTYDLSDKENFRDGRHRKKLKKKLEKYPGYRLMTVFMINMVWAI